MKVPKIWTLPWLKSRIIDGWPGGTFTRTEYPTSSQSTEVALFWSALSGSPTSGWSQYDQDDNNNIKQQQKHQQHRWVRWHAQSLKLPCRRNILPWSGGRPGFERQPVKKWRKSKISKKAWFFSFYLFSTSPYSKHTIYHCPALMSLAVVEEQLVQVSRLLPKERQ